MTTLQKIIKYWSIIFGIFLIFVIISSILGIGYTVNKILSPNKHNDIKEEITNVIDDIKDNTNDNSKEEPTKDIELTQEEFNNKMQEFTTNLDKYFSKGKALEDEIKQRLGELKYGEI